MNILAYQEISHAQAKLLQHDFLKTHSFRLPSPQQLQSISKTSDEEFKQTTALQKEFTKKKLKINVCLKVEELRDSKSVMRMIVSNLLACVFPPSESLVQQSEQWNHGLQLLNTLKCTLYCKDIRLRSLKNSDLSLEDNEAQSLIAHFIRNIEYYHQTEKDNRSTLRYCQWLIDNNCLLQESLLMALRYVLSQLQIQGANDCNQPLNVREAIINLVQYFDLTYRSFDQVLLFHQEKVFLALSQNDLILGTYSQQKHEGTGQVKENNKIWHQGSLVESIGAGEGLTSTQKLKRKTAVVQNDVKLFSCLLKSSRSEQEIKSSLKDYQGDTPHFKESKEINFGRKKKDESDIQKKREIKNQFARLILGSSQKDLNLDNSEIKEVDSHKSPSNSKKQNQSKRDIVSANNSSDGNSRGNDLKRPHLGDTMRKRVNFSNKRSSQGSSVGSQARCKNRVAVKVKEDRPTTPTAESPKKQRFGSLGNDFEFIFPEFAQNKQNNNAKVGQNVTPYSGLCPCFQNKQKRNALSSNVVNLIFMPVTKNKTSALWNNQQKKSAANQVPKIVVTSPQKYKEYYFRGDRVPTFLKAIIRKNEQSHQSKQMKNPSEKKVLPKLPEDGRRVFKHLSQIIPNRPADKSLSNEKRNSRGPRRQNIAEISSIKKYDFQQFRSREKERLGNPENCWKSTSNLYQQDNKYEGYRRTMQQRTMSPQLQNIISPFRTHSPHNRKNKYSTFEIGAHEEKDYTQQYENVMGYRQMAANKSEKVIAYQRDNV